MVLKNGQSGCGSGMVEFNPDPSLGSGLAMDQMILSKNARSLQGSPDPTHMILDWVIRSGLTDPLKDRPIHRWAVDPDPNFFYL